MSIRVSFGQSFGCLANPEEEVEFAAAFDRLNATVSERMFLGPWRLVEWWTGVDKIVAKDKKTVVDFSLDIIRKRRQAGYHKPQKDLLQLFMDLTDENGEPLSDDMLKDSILNFIIVSVSPMRRALVYTHHKAQVTCVVLTFYQSWAKIIRLAVTRLHRPCPGCST